MSERSKYAINGVYRRRNFAQHLATGQFPEENIGYYSSNSEVYITLKIREESNQVYPYISFGGGQNCRIRAFFNIKSKLWSLCYQTNGSIYLESDAGVSGPSINIQDVLNEENGYLEKGAFTVEYGLQIDAFLEDSGVWHFNLDDKLFNSKKENNTINIKCPVEPFEYYSLIPLLTFHSRLFHLEPKVVILQDGFYVEQCLQIANGVRLQYPDVSEYDWFLIAEVGQKLNLRNVVRYCDSMIIRTNSDLLNDEGNLKTAVKLNMRQCALHMIGLRKFKEVLEELRDDLDEMPGEIMKMLVARFIKEVF